MSTLLVEELFPGRVFVQNIRVTRNIAVAHIRPWIYKQGQLVDGDLVCRVKEGSTVLKEIIISSVDINAGVPADYSHGFMRVDVDCVLHVPDQAAYADYVFEFEMINHTFDANNFIGINRSWENKIYQTNYIPANDIAEPGGFEIYEWRQL